MWSTGDAPKEALAGFIPDEILEALSSASHGELKLRPSEATILAVRFEDFKTIAARMSAVNFSSMLGQYQAVIEEKVRGRRGLLYEFGGETMLALWNAPKAVAGHQASACGSALDAIAALEALNRELGLELGPMFRIGINSGTVCTGALVAGRRVKYGAWGDEANVASSLAGANRFFGTRILVSTETFAQAMDSFEGRPLGKVRLPGRETPTQVVEVLGQKGALPSTWTGALRSFRAGLESFMARDFRTASAAFAEVSMSLPGDGPSRLYAHAAQDFLEVPPPEGWDGVFTLTSG